MAGPMVLNALAANQVIRVQVRGIAYNQEDFNTYYYLVRNPVIPGPDSVFTSDVALAFRAAWRASILPLLTSDYLVLQYNIARIIQVNVVVGPPKRYVQVIDNQYMLPGDPVVAVGGTLPPSARLFDAMNVRRICQPDNKNFRPSNRYSPLPDTAVDANGQAGH